MFIFAQQEPPNITNWWQFVYMILPIVFTFVTSLTSLIFTIRNGQKIDKTKTDLEANTAKTDVIHDIVKEVQSQTK